MLCNSLKEKNCEYKQNCLCRLETVASHFSWKCASFVFGVQVTQVWTWLSGVCISDSVSVQLLESAPLVFTVPSFLAGVFCPVRFVCAGSCPCHHSLVTAVLPGPLLVWVRNNFQWRQELHGFPIWMSLFGSQGPEKEQFVIARILIEISDNFPRTWISGSYNIIQNLRNLKIL